jgi:hypothetical protein
MDTTAPKPSSTAALIATLNVDIARLQAEDAYRRDGATVPSERQFGALQRHYDRDLAAEKYDAALGSGRN